jgi:hypothetical protein
MGKIENSALGILSGRLGNLIIYQMKGKTIVRQRPGKKENFKSSPLQLFYQESFVLVQRFLLPIEAQLNIGFNQFSEGSKRGIHSAMSWAIKNAVHNENGKAVLNPEKVLISKGDLVQVNSLVLEKLEERNYRITWLPNGLEGSARDSDRCFILIYQPADKKTQFINSGAFRKQGFQNFQLLNKFSEEEFFVYVAFAQRRRRGVTVFSDSVCLKGM